MNEHDNEEAVTFNEISDFGREKFDQTKEAGCDAITSVTDYIRANPWISVAGAAVLGGVLVALTKSSKPQRTSLEIVRDWIDETAAKLPTQDDLCSVDLPKIFQRLKKSLPH